ncbi:predicted protein [Naegleria gruberi]|uniref:Predicted protein n=1 Tax=Naegleria gruberi TaxID=5762 RepID=D2VNG8_NAEGR|nr:uncharacterized protein NAEGRDRAFT_50996 [Naegleria gruberi]EFC41730.1 predicted protein [Naegleria gruberi]|eukprot:XP_002674474.1 predicted protein [Naegleria gruberi strain NEG-M]
MSEIVFELHETIECSLKRSEQVLEQALLSYEQFVKQSSNDKLPDLMDTTKLKHKMNLLVLERLQALQQIHTTFFEPLMKMTEAEEEQSQMHENLLENQFSYLHHDDNISSEEMELNAMKKIYNLLKTKLSKTIDMKQQEVIKQDIQKVEREIKSLESELIIGPIEETSRILSQIVETPIIHSKPPTPKNHSSSPRSQLIVSMPTVPTVVFTPPLEKKTENPHFPPSHPLQTTPQESTEHSGYWSGISSLSAQKIEEKKDTSPSSDLNSQLFESMIFDTKDHSPTFNETIHEQSSIMCDDSQIITSDSDSENEMYDHIFLTSQFLTKCKVDTHYRTPVREELRTPIKNPTTRRLSEINSRPSLLQSPKTPQKGDTPNKTSPPSKQLGSSLSEKRPKPTAYRRNMNNREPPQVPNHLGLSNSIRLAIPAKKTITK